MASENSRFGHLLKGYIFYIGKTETALANKICLSLNKLSAGINGTYRLKREHFDHIVTVLVEWGIELTADDYAELLKAWQREQTKWLPAKGPPVAFDPGLTNWSGCYPSCLAHHIQQTHERQLQDEGYARSFIRGLTRGWVELDSGPTTPTILPPRRSKKQSRRAILEAILGEEKAAELLSSCWG